MRDHVVPLALLATVAFAQASPPSDAQTQKNGSISGVVRRAGSGTPVAGAVVSVYTNSRFANGTIFTSIANTKEIQAVADEQGRYRLANLPASNYRVFARTPERHNSQEASRTAKLQAGKDLSSFDLFFPAEGSISGRVLDHNKEPLRRAAVSLVYREYVGGEVAYHARRIAFTNEVGEYQFPHVDAGVPYLLLATSGDLLRKGSDVPAEPELRKLIPVPTYFPISTRAEGAVPLMLRPDERREGVDVILRPAPSFCISGKAESPGQGVGRLSVGGGQISAGGNAVMPPSSFPVDADGKFKACGLPPGDYHLMATLHKLGDREDPAKLGWDQVTITKEDISDLHLYASPGQAVHGRVEWAGLAPEEPTAAKVVISLWARNRDGMVQGEQPDARAAIPGEFVVSNVFTGDYSAKAFVADASVYVQDVLYGSTSVFREPFHIGSAGGADELRVILARDGGTIAAKVADKDGNPLPDAKVVIMPAALRSEADLPDAMAVGETDQDGNYSYGVLRPGKYLVFATTARVDHSVESIAKLWGLSSRLEPVELGPNAQLQLTLTPLVIE